MGQEPEIMKPMRAALRELSSGHPNTYNAKIFDALVTAGWVLVYEQVKISGGGIYERIKRTVITMKGYEELQR